MNHSTRYFGGDGATHQLLRNMHARMYRLMVVKRSTGKNLSLAIVVATSRLKSYSRCAGIEAATIVDTGLREET